MNKNPNLTIVGFFGQSGAGKTTVIRNVDQIINGKRITPYTGIIRYLFNKNNTGIKKTYFSPQDLLRKYGKELEPLKLKERAAKIDEIYEKYIRSQMQLLNDFSTEVFVATQEKYHAPITMLVDRSPIDFYLITICGMKYLQDELKKKPNDHCKRLIELCKQTAEINTKNFFNAVFIVHPWKSGDINTDLNDGVRDQYLSDYYTGDNWYKPFKTLDIGSTQTFEIEGNITDLALRAKKVSNYLREV
jgi:hypothetical protein